MTEKPLYDVIDKAEPRGQSVTYEGIPCTARTCVTRLNRLTEENEQLKKREEQLLSEIKDFQQLLTKNDNICYKRVIDLIDARIKNGEEAIEWGKSMDADYGAMGFHVEMLKLLKKELEE